MYQAQLAESKSVQRGQGSYYTPPHLVDFVVEHTLGPLLADCTVDEIYRLRILDPSCGGGAFLLGVLAYLEEACVRLGARSSAALRRRLSACLVGIDLDAEALEVCRASLGLAVGGASQATLVLGDGLLPETPIPTADAIVGNPPWGQKGLKLSKEARARYKSLFTTARGTWDPFKFFVERAHQLLATGAPWGFVLPDIVLLKNLQEVRDVILGGSAITEIAHCGQAFEGANIDAVAICGRIGKARRNHALRVWPERRESWADVPPKTHSQQQSLFRSLPGHAFNLYLRGESLALYHRLQACPKLGVAVEMHEGVHTGNARKKLFLDERGARRAQKVIVGGKELARYALDWKGRWLNLEPDALDRSAGDYANLGKASWHGPNKIVVRRTGDRVIAAFDARGYYVSNNLFVLLDRREREGAAAVEYRRALVALLNSRLMTWYFRALVPRRGRLFAELKLVHLRGFPLPRVERMTAVQCELAGLAKRAEREGHEAVASAVDTLVESAYEISPTEREVIRLSE